MSNLNPVWSIGFQVEETIKANGLATGRKEVRAKAIEVLQNAGLADAEKRLKQFPHQFSGGMRQRVLIGIGLAAAPQLLIADEPTSALDVTVQRRILDHLETLTKTDGTALLFITHDLGLAAERAEKLIVMYKGRIVESGASVEVLQNPQHPYTQRLIAAAPSLASRRIQSTAGAATEAVPGESADVREVDLVRAAGVHTGVPAATATPMIEVENLTKVFKIRRGGLKAEDFTAVDEVSFSIPKGTTTALVGSPARASRRSRASCSVSRRRRAERSRSTAVAPRSCAARRCWRSGARCSRSSRTRTGRSTRCTTSATPSRSR